MKIFPSSAGRMFLVVSLPALATVFSCAVVDKTSDVPERTDGDPSASDSGRADGASDSLPADAAPTDAQVPKSLEVVCTEEPCYIAVSGSRSRHFCGLVRDGTVRCWGRDSKIFAASLADGGSSDTDGALGRGSAVSILEGATPALVVGLASVTQLSVGPNFGTCARTEDGSVYCWGRNDLGQLGRPPSELHLSTPTRVEGLPPVDEVQLGFETGCAIASSDRALYCWGRWMPGLGGDAGTAATLEPRRVDTFRPPLEALAIGTWAARDTIVALREGNILASAGELAIGETSLSDRTVPLEMPGVAKIGAFAFVGTDGVVRRWGPSPADAAVFAAGLTGSINLPTSGGVVDVKISAANNLDISPLTDHQGGALLSTGRLFRWGLNTAGTLGVAPDELVGIRKPLEVTQLAGQVISFATTVSSTCASLVDGKIKCWGSNYYGELGRGTADTGSHPNAEVIR